jgi:hypothetical protein
MELLKVFVGDGSSASTIATMTQGDLLLVKASDNSVLTASTAAALTASDQVKIVGKNSKGLVYSTPFSRNDVIKVNYTGGTGVTQKKLTVTLTEILGTSATVSTTYSLGVQIKEDLRMGTYNKNTEVIVSATTPSTAYSGTGYSTVGDAATADITSTMAKGFAANPLTSAGSPSQLVKVTRAFTGTATAVGGASATFEVIQGARQVAITGTVSSAPTVGNIIDVNGSTYLVEAYDSTNKIITLDTAFQGSTATGLDATTLLNKLAAITAWTFVFEGVAQSRTNKFDQYRVVDFIVIYPKGLQDSGISVAETTALVYGKGTWAQVRDMEERSFTNISPLVNYREFPFSDFNLNTDLIATNTNFNLFTIVHNTVSGYGYNFMQSSAKTFPQVTVAAAPTSSNDGTVGSNNYFGSVLTAWWSADSTPTSAQFA